MLRFNQLTKQFYSLTALNQLSLRINEGEIVGLLGPNGAGKTTLLKILAGLLQPTKGTVEADQRAWPRIGYKPERPMFPSGMGVAQYLQTCVGLTDVPRSGQKRAVERVLSQVGLTSIANNRIRDCSKGMRQRIGLAQALLGDPQLLILDEPSDGLDPTGQQDIQQLLRQLRDDGVTIVLSSHHLAEVTAVCTRLIILNRGRIAYQKPMQKALAEKPQTVIQVDRSLTSILPLLTSIHPKISIDTDLRILYIPDEVAVFKRDVLCLLLGANYDIVQITHQTATLADIYAEVIHS